MKKTIYSVLSRGNFYQSGIYQEGLDLFFVLASTPEEASIISNNNISVITDMFKNKILANKKRALRLKETCPVRIGNIRPSGMNSFDKVLTEDGEFVSI